MQSSLKGGAVLKRLGTPALVQSKIDYGAQIYSSNIKIQDCVMTKPNTKRLPESLYRSLQIVICSKSGHRIYNIFSVVEPSAGLEISCRRFEL